MNATRKSRTLPARTSWEAVPGGWQKFERKGEQVIKHTVVKHGLKGTLTEYTYTVSAAINMTAEEVAQLVYETEQEPSVRRRGNA